MLNAINRAFGSKRFPGPAAVEFEAQLVGFGLHHFQNRGDSDGGGARCGQIPPQTASERGEDASFAAFACLGCTGGQKQIASVNAVVRERIRDEFFLCLAAPASAEALRQLREYGLLAYAVPALQPVMSSRCVSISNGPCSWRWIMEDLRRAARLWRGLRHLPPNLALSPGTTTFWSWP